MLLSDRPVGCGALDKRGVTGLYLSLLGDVPGIGEVSVSATGPVTAAFVSNDSTC